MWKLRQEEVGSFLLFPVLYILLSAHAILRRNREHRVLAIKDFQDKDYEDVLKRPVFCSRQDHQEEELKYYCKECETTLCQTCFALDHGGHALKLITEEAETQKLEIKSVIEMQRKHLEAKMKEGTQLDETYAQMIQQNEIVKREAQRFADSLIKTIQTKLQDIINTVENQTKKSLESLTAKKNEIQHQINVIESSLEEADKLLKRSTKAEIVHLKKSLQTIFQGVDQTEAIVLDPSGHHQAFVFLENQTMLGFVNGEEIGFLEEPYRTKASESLVEGGGLKEGTVGNKAQFNLITRNEGRKQGYDKCDRVTVDIKDEQEREGVTQVRIDDNKNGMYNIAYYPTVQGTLGLLVKVNGKHICGSPFNVTIKEYHGKPVSCLGRLGSGNGMFQDPRGVAVTDSDEIVVADNAGVQVFDSNGTFLRSFALQSYSYPFGVAITKERTIFLAEYGNHRVQIFSWEGRHLGSFGSEGNLDSKLRNPRGLSLDSNGNVIVADTGNKLIKIFTPDGRFLMKIGGQGSLSDPVHCVQCGEYLVVATQNAKI